MKTLDEALGKIVIYDEDEIDWTLEDLVPDGASDIRRAIADHLKTLKRIVPKPKFGDQTSIENALYNKVIDDLIMDITEGKQS